MSHLSRFLPIPDLSHVLGASKASLRCLAIVLRDKSLCVWSPVRGLNNEAQESLGRSGEVSCLVAPNHYHHAGLEEYAASFPQARLYAPKEAQPRLRRQTGHRFHSLDRLREALPRGMSFVETKGLKTGEAWLRIRQRGMCAWAVVDAFGGAKGKTCSKPAMLGTFPRYGVGDTEVYKGWVLKRIAADGPTLIIPCHGALFCGAGLPARLDALVRKSL